MCAASLACLYKFITHKNKTHRILKQFERFSLLEPLGMRLLTRHPITKPHICIKLKYFNTSHFNLLASLCIRTWKLTFRNKQRPQNPLTENLSQTTKGPDFQEWGGVSDLDTTVQSQNPDVWSTVEVRTLFCHKQYRKYNYEKKRERERDAQNSVNK